MDASNKLVMTIIAQDRPGLVDLISGIVAEHSGNWLESRMAHLGGQFAGILSIALPAGRQSSLESALQALAQQGIVVTIQPAGPEESAPSGAAAELELVGQDRPGIVRQIAQALARHQVNVEELETECVSAPMSGERLFQARARVQLPADCSAEALSQALEKIANDLMVDLAFKTLSPEKNETRPPA